MKRAAKIVLIGVCFGLILLFLKISFRIDDAAFMHGYWIAAVEITPSRVPTVAIVIPEVMSDISGICMYDILYYAYEHLEECKLILCCSEGTKFAGLIDEMVEIEVDGTHAYQDVLRQLGRSSPHIDPSLEHILITGMFHTFFELIIHEMPLKDAENYVKEMRAFYTAGWMKIMGQ